MKKETLKIEGMHCASCALNIEKGVQKLEGVDKSSVNYATGSAYLEYDESKVTKDQISTSIDKLGYQVLDEKKGAPEHDHLDHGAEEKALRSRVTISVLLTVPIFIRMFYKWDLDFKLFGLGGTELILWLFSTIIVFWLGWQFHVGMIKQLRNFRADMDTLISLGTLSAYIYSVYAIFAGQQEYFETAATITTLILLGRYLEERTKGRASEAMKKLMELTVKKAKLITSDGIKEVSIDKIKIGDVIKVNPSEKIPLDGEVLKGHSEVDESMVTGESMPVTKDIKADVFGGTINKNGVLEIKVTLIGEDTVLGQIIKTVEQAQAHKAPIQKLADKVAGIFVPTVLGLALITLLGWTIYSGDFGNSLIKAVAVLIISCPCALGIATPIAVMVGSTQGSKNGILIKRGESFEKAKDISTIIFDKTGTLSKGDVAVDDIIWNGKVSDENKRDRLSNIAQLEAQSEHPLAQAIAKHDKSSNKKDVNVKDFKEIRGKGISGQINSEEYLVGNEAFIEEQGMTIPPDLNKKKQSLENKGKTVVIAAAGGTVQCIISLFDQLKPNSIKTIRKARSMGLKTIMITGDNKRTAKTVARELKIDSFHAEVLPKEKSEIIKKIQMKGDKVAFAGDGINDAPALVQSDLGIAMGKGTDIAKESGDIVLVNNDPLKIIQAIKLSKKTYKIIKQNLFWAFFYNVLAIPLAMFGIVNPMIAALAMAFSDVTVVGNALRLKK